MCGGGSSISNNYRPAPTPPPATTQAAPPSDPCAQQPPKTTAPENPTVQALNQDRCQVSPAAQRQAVEQQKIDAKENAITTLQNNDGCGLSREQMVQALNGAGVGGRALNNASDSEVSRAYSQLAQAAQTPGEHKLKLDLGGKEFKAKVDVASDGNVTELSIKKHGGGAHNCAPASSDQVSAADQVESATAQNGDGSSGSSGNPLGNILSGLLGGGGIGNIVSQIPVVGSFLGSLFG